MTLLLLQFNNYFNRVVKKYDAIEDYISNSSNFHYTANSINFNPNDQIVTEQVINWDQTWNPDYLLCIDKNNNICGRWFIIKATRTRGGQYNLSLKRDTVAEKYNTIISSPCFVQKGFVNASNPLIFNKEDFNCNQIKKFEIPIRDLAESSWIVLYYNLSAKNELHGEIATATETYINLGTATIEDSFLGPFIANGYKETISKEFKIKVGSSYYADKVTHLQAYRFRFDSSANFEEYEGLENYLSAGLKYNGFGTVDKTKKALIEIIDSNKENIATAIGNEWNQTTSLQTLLQYRGALVKTNDNKFHRITIEATTRSSEVANMDNNSARTAIENAFKEDGEFKEYWSGNFNNSIQQRITYQYYSVKKELVTNTLTEYYSYDFRGCKDIKDQPYGIICLPYKKVPSIVTNYLFQVGGNVYPIKENLSVLIANDLLKKGDSSSAVIYDAQILPFCPISQLSYATLTGFQLSQLQNDDYTIIGLRDSPNTPAMFALHPTYSKFSKDIMGGLIDNITTLLSEKGVNLNNIKLENQCSFMRLCSPNFNGQFEFNYARNRGIKFFNVDCTYKPYQPYIHINPNFSGLYGSDFDDPRGLVCGGDFSLTRVTSAFETYKLQNKNYNEIFARQIENMDVQHDIGIAKEAVSLLTSTAGGAAKGAVTGGNPISLAIGAAQGLVSGATDLIAGQASFKEQKNYATDMHNLQLGNIKAAPDSLTKVDAFNNNFKIWPILEYYTCTDEEKEIFKNKITYEGMTINSVATIFNYVGSDRTFIKGQLIRLEGIEEDSNFAQDIYNEISKGVYI